MCHVPECPLQQCLLPNGNRPVTSCSGWESFSLLLEHTAALGLLEAPKVRLSRVLQSTEGSLHSLVGLVLKILFESVFSLFRTLLVSNVDCASILGSKTGWCCSLLALVLSPVRL